MFFGVAQAVPGEQGDEVLRCVTGQRRFAETRVVADEVFLGVTRVQAPVGKVATPTPRNSDFFGNFFGVIEQQNPQTTLACDARTHQAGGAGAHDDGVIRVRGCV